MNWWERPINPTGNRLSPPWTAARLITGGRCAHCLSGVGGFMNCSKSGWRRGCGGGQEFSPRLETEPDWEHIRTTTVAVTLLISSVGGPDADLPAVGPAGPESLALQFIEPAPTIPARMICGSSFRLRGTNQPHLQLDQTGADQQPVALNFLCALRENPNPAAAKVPSPLTGAIARGRRASWCEPGGAGAPVPAAPKFPLKAGPTRRVCLAMNSEPNRSSALRWRHRPVAWK